MISKKIIFAFFLSLLSSLAFAGGQTSDSFQVTATVAYSQGYPGMIWMDASTDCKLTQKGELCWHVLDLNNRSDCHDIKTMRRLNGGIPTFGLLSLCHEWKVVTQVDDGEGGTYEYVEY